MLRQITFGVIKFRALILAIIVLITAFFGYYSFKTQLRTDFNDLLPHGHPYVKIHKNYRDRFGGANITTIVLEVKEGDIYNMKTLEKIQNINKAMYYIPNINNLQVTSIADRKVKNVVSDAEGLYRGAVMWPTLPKNEAEIKVLKETIMGNIGIYGQLVSFDNKMLLLYADFWEKAIDYRIIFEKLREIVSKESDENHIIHMAGEPVLYGWVYHFFPQMVRIFLLSFAIILVLLFVYTRSIRGTLLPLISAGMCAIWGFGFASLLGYNFDPLILVIPVLITSMLISHTVQMVSRFDWEVVRVKDPVLAAERALYGVFAPAILSIITDAAGIAIITITPIPVMKKLAVMGSFWVMSSIINVIILMPILLSYLPMPKKALGEKPETYSVFDRFLGYAGRSFFSGGKYVTLVITVALLLWGVYYSRTLIVGDPRPGSPILWPESIYNQDVAVIDKNFPGTNQMYVVFDALDKYKTKRDQDSEMVCKRPHVLLTFNDFQRYLERLPEIGLTISLADFIPGLNMKLMADNPRWEQFPFNRDHSGELFQMLMSGSDPGDLDRYTNFDYTEASIIMYYKNRTGDTLRKVIGKCKEWIKHNPLEEGQFYLAGGIVAILSAINETILHDQTMSIILALGFVFITCCITYRSLFAGILFVIPIAITNFLTFSYMAFKGIGLNINTLPVASMGIGLGVDYGLYVVSRIKEEYHESGDLKKAIDTAMMTAGKAVLFTASMLVAATVFWYFLSDLKFQAEMGLMLSLWLFVAMLGGLFLVPTLVAWVKPNFVFKAKGMLE